MPRKDQTVADFYNSVGWETEDGITEDARLWEDLRPCARDYISKCRRRLLRHIPSRGSAFLDMASGPVQYPEYLEYSRNFEKHYCVDLSSSALAGAKKKLGDRGVYLHGDFLELPFEEDYFDCAVSLHTIYHIDEGKQEDTVRKLLRVLKPEAPLIVVYNNPNSVMHYALSPLRLFRDRVMAKSRSTARLPYTHSYPLTWWYKYSDIAEVKLYPWRSFCSSHQKFLFPNGPLGSTLLGLLFRLEEGFPGFFTNWFQYPMIVLTKKRNPSEEAAADRVKTA